MSYSYKIDQFLTILDQKSEGIGSVINLYATNDYPLGSCETPEAFNIFLKMLKKADLIDFQGSSLDQLFLTLKAYERIEKIKSENTESNQAFIAMWFPQKEDIENRKEMEELSPPCYL